VLAGNILQAKMFFHPGCCAATRARLAGIQMDTRGPSPQQIAESTVQRALLSFAFLLLLLLSHKRYQNIKKFLPDGTA